MWRHLLDLVVGTIVVAAIYFALADLPLPVMAIAYLLGMIVGGFNTILFIVVVIMLVVAARWRRPGIALAPFLFAGLWYASAVAQRMAVEAHEDQKLAEWPVPAELRGARTLIIASQVTQLCCGQTTLLADGLIDRDADVFLDHDHKLSRIEAYTLGRGGECSAEDRAWSVLLACAGRTEDCIRRERVNAIPDGIAVRMIPFAAAYAAMGGRNRGTISLRAGGLVPRRPPGITASARCARSAAVRNARLGRAGAVLVMAGQRRASTAGRRSGGPAFHHASLPARAHGIDWRAPVKAATAWRARTRPPCGVAGQRRRAQSACRCSISP